MKYNCNSDKGSLETYGFTDEYPNAESWEFLNNTSDACLFHGEISDTWVDDFEARWPEDYEDIKEDGNQVSSSIKVCSLNCLDMIGNPYNYESFYN